MIRHTIHLRGGWVTEVLGPEYCSRRNFGRPRTLDPDERLWLVCGEFPPQAQVLFNDELLGLINPAGELAADITSLLRLRNTLCIRCPSQQPIGTTRLEVRTMT